MNATMVGRRMKIAFHPPASLGIESVARPPLSTITGKRPIGMVARFGHFVRSVSARSAWTAGAAAAMAVGLLLAGPAIGSFAEGTLQSFRVQRIQAVTIDPAVIRSQFERLGINEARLRDALRYRGPSEPTITLTSVADASNRSGLKLRVPASLPRELASLQTRAVVVTGSPVEVTVDAGKLIALARDAGAKDGTLTVRIQELDGMTFKGQSPTGAGIIWGDVPVPTDARQASRKTVADEPDLGKGPILVVGQFQAPQLDVPAGVNVDALKDAIVGSGLLPPELAKAMSGIRDWKTTLPLLAPTGRGEVIREVAVDGATATLASRTGSPLVTVVWVRDGIVHGVASNLGEAAALQVARSLVPAK
ncbi:MAG: hypothetical protein EXR45_02295 [Chloroflexi bacterium]|nr:hypothetical protein [Chloroflexota bacterium]